MTRQKEDIKASFVEGNALLHMPAGSGDKTARAIRNLEIMDHNGELALPEPWMDGEVQVASWDPSEGTVLDCYLDMLGLNGREPADSAKWGRQKKVTSGG